LLPGWGSPPCAPEPGDDRGFRAVWKLGLGIKIADALPRLLTHPAAVIAYVLGQALCALGIPDAAVREFLSRLGIDRRQACEFRRELDQRLADHHCHGVEVGGVGAQAQALRLERDRAAAAERVVDGGSVLKEVTAHGSRVVLVRRLLAPAPG
jgi:hypothetical protein